MFKDYILMPIVCFVIITLLLLITLGVDPHNTTNDTVVVFMYSLFVVFCIIQTYITFNRKKKLKELIVQYGVYLQGELQTSFNTPEEAYDKAISLYKKTRVFHEVKHRKVG